MYEADDVQQPGRRDEGGQRRNGMEAEQEEDVAAVKATMLLDFKEVMKGGVFVEARSSLSGVSMRSLVSAVGSGIWFVRFLAGGGVCFCLFCCSVHFCTGCTIGRLSL